jgi:hypothetical protein
VHVRGNVHVQESSGVAVQFMWSHLEHLLESWFVILLIQVLNFRLEDNKILVRKAGGIDRILEAMTRFRSHQTVQEYACGALWNLTRNGNILKGEIELNYCR